MRHPAVIAALALLSTTTISAQALRTEPYALRTYDGREFPAELGHLTVPERRSSARSPRITLAFVRLKSTSATPSAPIVWLAGGPGVPGIGMARVPVYYALFEQLRSVADVILLDQRSLGLSTPNLDCRDPHPPKDLFRSAETWLAAADNIIKRCDRELRAKGIDASAYTIDEVADDIEDLRIALGAGKVSLIGHSFGTLLALEILRRHPASVERVVIANVEGDDRLIALPRMWDMLLNRLSAFAARDSSVPAEGRDLLMLANRVAKRLDAHPLTLAVKNSQSGDTATIVVGGFGLRWIMRNYMADARTYARLPAMLLALDRGHYEAIASEIAPYYFGFGRSQMATVTDCSAGWSPERLAAANRDSGAFFHMVNQQWKSNICRTLGYRGRAADRPLLFSSVPALFISGTLDANTPPYQAEEVRSGFPYSSHLVVENAGHETLPSPEVQQIVLDFFRGADVSSRHVGFPPPRFQMK